MNKFIIAFTVLCFSLFTNTIYAQWERVNIPNGRTINSLAGSDTNLFAGTDSGIFLSSDNGASWKSTGMINIDIGVFTASGTNIYARADTGDSIFLSTDNGTSWKKVNMGSLNAYINSLAASGANLFAATNHGVFISNDTGMSWKVTGFNGNSLAIAASGSNIYVKGNPYIYHSNDNGATWYSNVAQNPADYYALAASGTNLFIGLGIDLQPGMTYDLVLSPYGVLWESTGWADTLVPVSALAVNGTNLFALTGDTLWKRPLNELVSVKTPLHQNTVQFNSKIKFTKYFSMNGKRLAVRNGKAIAPAGNLIIVRNIDINGMVNSSKEIVK